MARGNKRFEVVMSGMAWELKSGYVVKSNNITGGPIHLFSPPKMETFRGRTGRASSFRDNARVVRRIQSRGTVHAHGSCAFPVRPVRPLLWIALLS
ncbi:hypothetical protein L6452_04706 [Arctium lappa]|uniref:Uncharacterized protein n=1 Tax=Arctium lappa TaxID=4217 RepID=A0ACB9EED2_ARCLA|nr:hypothetical protein L6452_04706 [Arctium lappa]